MQPACTGFATAARIRACSCIGRTRSGCVDRNYRLRLDADLFGQATVLREWGSIGSPGKVRVDVMLDDATAEAWHARLLRAKTRKGYVPP